MGNAFLLRIQETLRGTALTTKAVPRSLLDDIPTPIGLMSAAGSLADQELVLVGGFLVLKDTVTGIGQ